MNPLAYIPPPPTNGIRVGPLFFHLYGLCIALGILAAVSVARRRWQRAGHDPAELERAAFWGVLAGFVGGRLGYVVTHTGDFQGRWLHVVAIWEGGLALYGGLTLGLTVGALVAWRQGLPVAEALDAAIPGIPLAQAFGRWGNYFNQELFGTPTKLPWGLEVEPQYRPDRYAGFETFHPTFLYESLYNLLVFALLIWIGNTRRLRAGSLVLCYAIFYGTGRFLLELLRTDTTYRLFGLSRNAYVSILVVVVAATALVLRERGGRERAGEEPAEGTAAEGERAAEGEAAAEGQAASEAPAASEAAAEGEAASEAQAASEAAAEGEGAGGGEAASEAPAAEDATGEPAAAQAGPADGDEDVDAAAAEQAEREGQPERR